MKRIIAILLLVVFLTASAIAADRGPSTPEERARVLKLVAALEADPLSKELTAEREWAFLWLIQVPDVSVSICTVNMPWEEKYKFAGDLVVLSTLAAARFVIEHPEQAKDDAAVALGAMTTTLRAYERILAAHPKRRSKGMDEMLQREKDGTLAAFLKEAWEKDCSNAK